MRQAKRGSVLLVDDDANLLRGLRLVFRRKYAVHMATGGEEGLTVLEAHPSIDVVISDMRMPGMNGAEFLSQVRERWPLVTRVLLTGHADIDAAVQAINEGGLSRFLLKPCPPQVLLEAVEQGVEQRRLREAERELLEKTLRGAIRALTDVIALTKPAVAGHASRVARLARALAEAVELPGAWEVEVAALLAPVGMVTLPEELVARLYRGERIDAAERGRLERLPELTDKLLRNIPRLEGVREIIRRQGADYGGGTATASSRRRTASQVLRAAHDFDLLVQRGRKPAVALASMARRKNVYNPQVLDALGRMHGASVEHRGPVEVSLSALEPGMVLAADMYMDNGVLLVGKGYEVTEGFLARLESVRDRVRDASTQVIAPKQEAA